MKYSLEQKACVSDEPLMMQVKSLFYVYGMSVSN